MDHIVRHAVAVTLALASLACATPPAGRSSTPDEIGADVDATADAAPDALADVVQVPQDATTATQDTAPAAQGCPPLPDQAKSGAPCKTLGGTTCSNAGSFLWKGSKVGWPPLCIRPVRLTCALDAAGSLVWQGAACEAQWSSATIANSCTTFGWSTCDLQGSSAMCTVPRCYWNKSAETGIFKGDYDWCPESALGKTACGGPDNLHVYRCMAFKDWQFKDPLQSQPGPAALTECAETCAGGRFWLPVAYCPPVQGCFKPGWTNFPAMCMVDGDGARCQKTCAEVTAGK